MLRAGDLSPPPLRPSSAAIPLLSRIFRRALGLFGSSSDDGDNVALAGDSYIIAPLLEGVKVCLSSGAACAASSADYSVLHLIWTAEKLEQQLDLIDQRYQKSRNSALASLKCGNKKIALRYPKELKLTSQSRERCSSLLDRVEEVLQVITDAESSKKVAEAIKGSTRAMQENKISIEEVELCLQDVDENIDSLKQLDNALVNFRSLNREDSFIQL